MWTRRQFNREFKVGEVKLVTERGVKARVAQVVWQAATDTSGQLRFPAGADAIALASAAHSPVDL